MSKPDYRPDIDGLRAVAVLLVVLFHTGFRLFPGGFIGVDVFFAISGFLITGLIYRDIVAGQFTFASFYRRRLRRLMPALFAVVLATTLMSLWLLLPNELESFARSIVATALSVSNVFFWRENGGYFANNATEVPLLHTWSLAVEEQYYLVWPALLIVATRLFRRRWLALTSAAVLVSSLLLSEYAARVTYGASYYLLPTRMFELMIGSLLALVWDRLPVVSGRVNSLLSVAGLAAIVGSALWLDGGSIFPGFNALYPSAGAGLLILSGRGPQGVVNRLLATRPFVFVGLISYSVYLWHWPLVVAVKRLALTPSPVLSAALLAASLALGWLSWKYIEQPFRWRKAGFWPTLRHLYLAPLAAILLVAATIIGMHGLPQRFSPAVVAMEQAFAARPARLRAGCHVPTRASDTPPDAACRLGELGHPEQTALLIGDSHANHFTGFFDELGRAAGLQLQDYTLDACLPVAGLDDGASSYFASLCRQRNDASMRYLATHHFDYVVLAGNWPSYPMPQFPERLAATLDLIRAAGATPVLVRKGAPAAGGFKCPVTHALFNHELSCRMPRADAERMRRYSQQVFDDLQARFAGLVLIDPMDAMCDRDFCYSDLAGVPLYLDEWHLNDRGSRAMATAWLAHHPNPFLPPHRAASPPATGEVSSPH